MLKRKFILLACIILVLAQMTGCFTKNTTISSKESPEKSEEIPKETDEVERCFPGLCFKIDENKDNIHKIKEDVISQDAFDDILEPVDTYTIKVNVAKILSPQEANITVDYCYHSYFPDFNLEDCPNDFHCESNQDKLKNAKILYLKFDIKKIHCDYIPHIDSFTPCYKVDDYSYRVGDRVYLEYDNEDKKGEGAIYLAQGQTKEITAAWVVDPEILGIDNFDPANLYIIMNCPQDISLPRDFIDLGLGEQ